jgi:hypothetical protein
VRTTENLLPLAAVVANALAAGATADQAFKQLPARRRIGPVAYAEYVRAADLHNGLRWYPPLGLGAAATTLAAATSGLRRSQTRSAIAALVVTAVGTLGHLAATGRAAPTLLSLRHGHLEPVHAAAVLDRFASINAARTAAMAVTLAASVTVCCLPGRHPMASRPSQ